jgi:hypothetical protein
MNLDWLESVQLVFDYFCERTPRSFVETRETSLVWNYKYADPEFGMIQVKPWSTKYGASYVLQQHGLLNMGRVMYCSNMVY